jgi:Family of unknown function (DUF5701)
MIQFASTKVDGGDDMSAATAAEFDRQLENLLAKGYERVVGLTVEEFRTRLEPLRLKAASLEDPGNGTEAGRIPFVTVVNGDLVAAETAVELVERRGRAGFSVLEPDDLRRFQPIASVDLPRGSAYLIVDVDTGHDTRNVTPTDALERIQARGRSPLTIEEGIALITHHPEAVAKNAGFSLPGSRCGDRRVTALWISEGRPKLGWCWAGNPHTWLGSASCARRLGASTAGQPGAPTGDSANAACSSG